MKKYFIVELNVKTFQYIKIVSRFKKLLFFGILFIFLLKKEMWLSVVVTIECSMLKYFVAD